jgi:ABC-2 type transport system permease protein
MKEFVIQCVTLWWREITRFRRQRSRVVGAILQPLVFWALLGAGLKASFRPSGVPHEVNYVQYFYPGVLVLVLLFTAIFATISAVEDRKEGFLQGVLVAPIARSTVVIGQAMGGATLALIQGTIFLVFAPFARIPLGWAPLAISLGVMALMAFALTCVGLVIAWRIDSTQGFHSIMNLILIPMWLLSGAFFPAEGVPAWLGWTMKINPLSYGMAALRKGLYFDAPQLAASGPNLGWSLAITAAFALAAFAAAAYSSRVSRIG